MLRVALILLVGCVVLAGCRRGQQNPRLPDEATFYLESPQEEGNAQPLCASDTAAYDELLTRIQTYNEQLQNRIELIKAILSVGARQLERDGEAEYSTERNGFVITLNAVEDEAANVTYALTVTTPEGETVRVLEGSANAARSAGTWNVLNAQGEVVVEVEWTNEDDTLIVNRTAGERSSVYVRNADVVTLDFTGPNHTANAQWDRQTKDGSIIIDGNETCWDASDDLLDFCTVDCGAA
jgi:hypothetical protein